MTRPLYQIAWMAQVLDCREGHVKALAITLLIRAAYQEESRGICLELGKKKLGMEGSNEYILLP